MEIVFRCRIVRCTLILKGPRKTKVLVIDIVSWTVLQAQQSRHHNFGENESDPWFPVTLVVLKTIPKPGKRRALSR